MSPTTMTTTPKESPRLWLRPECSMSQGESPNSTCTDNHTASAHNARPPRNLSSRPGEGVQRNERVREGVMLDVAGLLGCSRSAQHACSPPTGLNCQGAQGSRGQSPSPAYCQPTSHGTFPGSPAPPTDGTVSDHRVDVI
ncbi:hypothetical protein GCM10027300_41260 [Modestobacter lapidis]